MKIMIFKSPYLCHANIDFPIIVEAEVKRIPNLTVVAKVNDKEFEEFSSGWSHFGITSFLFESSLNNPEFKIVY